MVLEVAEARLNDVSVSGSLLVYAENVVGHMTVPLTVHGLQYGEEGMQLQARLPNELAMRHVTAQVMTNHGGSRSLPSTLPSSVPSSESGGGDPDERLVYSSRCGRIHLSNVVVRNRGVDWTAKSNL